MEAEEKRLMNYHAVWEVVAQKFLNLHKGEASFHPLKLLLVVSSRD